MITMFNPEKMRYQMALHGYSSSAVAKEIGVNVNTIQRTLRGATKPKPQTLKAIADVLDCSVSDFCDIDNNATGEDMPPMDMNTSEFVNKGGRPKIRGEVKRASLFIDADLSFALKMQAAMENKSVSILISEIARDYLNKKGTLEKANSITNECSATPNTAGGDGS